MQGISIVGTAKTPTVHYNEQKNTLFIGGRSLPEHPALFYQDIYQWFNNYFLENHSSSLVVVVMLEYCNTTSSKVLLDLFSKLSKKLPLPDACTLAWYFESDDPDTKDLAEVISTEKLLKVEIIEVSKFNPSPYLAS
jgi:hypothetical protein